MYKRILIPTDGSSLSTASAKAGVQLARALGATVVGFYATPPYSIPYYVDYVPQNFVSPQEHERLIRKTADKYLAVIERAATAAGVPYEAYTEVNEYADDAIVKAARRKKCDLIFIGSHGRSGLGRFFLGSVTTRVLSECDVPVLVYRQSRFGRLAAGKSGTGRERPRQAAKTQRIAAD